MKVLLILSILFYSCNKIEPDTFKAENIIVDYVNFQKSQFNNNLELELKYPKFSSTKSYPILDSLEKQIHKNLFQFAEDSISSENHEAFLQLITKKYENELNRFPNSELQWDIKRDISVDHLSDHLISIKITIDDKTGSGFDFKRLFYRQIDPVLGKVINVRSLINEKHMSDFIELHNEKIAKALETKHFTGRNLKLMGSFYFTDNSIIFNYNKYQLMPFTENELLLEIDLNEFEEFLNPHYKYLWKNE
jgi:hypothetical protein